MSPAEFEAPLATIQCDACRSAMDPDGQQSISFLLVDQLRIPMLSCDDHLSQFTSICGLTTDDTADLLHHRPAGGVCCPACRRAPYTAGHSMIPVQDGVIVPMACPKHQAELVQRFQSGLLTNQQLTSSLDTPTNGSR